MVTVTDPSYPEQPLFEYDIGIGCPAPFSLDFTIPTQGPDSYNKYFRVQIHDTFRTIHMNVFRPAPNISEETLGKTFAEVKSHEIDTETGNWIYLYLTVLHSLTKNFSATVVTQHIALYFIKFTCSFVHKFFPGNDIFWNFATLGDNFSS